MNKYVTPLALATGLAIGLTLPFPTPPPAEHTHPVYEEQLRTLDEQYQLLFEDVAQLRKEFDASQGSTINVSVDWPHKFDRHEERLGQIEYIIHGKDGILKRLGRGTGR